MIAAAHRAVVAMTESGGRRAHLLTDDQAAQLLRGALPRAVCGVSFTPAGLTVPAAPTCPACLHATAPTRRCDPTRTDSTRADSTRLRSLLQRPRFRLWPRALTRPDRASPDRPPDLLATTEPGKAPRIYSGHDPDTRSNPTES